MKILIVEDTRELATNLVRYLSLKGIHSEISFDGKDALHKAATKYFDAIILDINLPEMSGIEVCRELRKREKDVPIIMLTSRSSKGDIIIGLEAGADDYLTKPFDYDILIARIQALTRRNLKNKSTSVLTFPGYEMDLEKLEVRKNPPVTSDTPLIREGQESLPMSRGDAGKAEEITQDELAPIHLSHLEFELLKYFAQNKDRAIDRQELYEKVWGEFEGDVMFSKTVDVYIGYLRKKLGRDIVETKKGFGYIMHGKK